jgi:hypothetical protein
VLELGIHQAVSAAPDRATWEQALTDARALEAAAFMRAGLANLAYCGERGWVRLDGLVGT